MPDTRSCGPSDPLLLLTGDQADLASEPSVQVERPHRTWARHTFTTP